MKALTLEHLDQALQLCVDRHDEPYVYVVSPTLYKVLAEFMIHENARIKRQREFEAQYPALAKCFKFLDQLKYRLITRHEHVLWRFRNRHQLDDME